MNTIPSVSTSAISAYKRCREYYRLAYVDGWRSTRQDSRAFGIVMHAALAAWWLAPDEQELIATNALIASGGKNGLGLYEMALAHAMLVGYHQRWIATRSLYSVIAIEDRFQLLRHSYKYTGIIDGKVTRADRRCILEHKTTHDRIGIGEPYWEQLAMNDQLGLYFEAHPDAQSCIYDVLRVPALEPKLATPEADRKYTKAGKLYAVQRETDEGVTDYLARVVETLSARPDDWFARQEVFRLDHEKERDKKDLDTIARDMIRVEPGEPQPRSQEACGRYGSRCEFFHYCAGTAQLEDLIQIRKRS